MLPGPRRVSRSFSSTKNVFLERQLTSQGTHDDSRAQSLLSSDSLSRLSPERAAVFCPRTSLFRVQFVCRRAATAPIATARSTSAQRRAERPPPARTRALTPAAAYVSLRRRTSINWSASSYLWSQIFRHDFHLPEASNLPARLPVRSRLFSAVVVGDARRTHASAHVRRVRPALANTRAIGSDRPSF